MISLSLYSITRIYACYFLFFANFFFVDDTHAQNIIITDVSIISGEDPKPSEPVDVHISKGLITYIGKKTIDENAKKVVKHINGKNKFLIPGLIDTHVHLSGGVPGLNVQGLQQTGIEEEALSQIPKSYLYFGFTTLLDLVSYSDFIDQWNKQKVAPKAYFCSPIIIPNGYPIMPNQRQNQFESNQAAHIIYNPEQASIYPKGFPKEERSPRSLIQKAKNDGAMCIKVFFEKGFGQWRNLPVPSASLVKQIVKYAHAQSMKVYLHGNSQSSYEFALSTKVDTLVHGMWLWYSLLQADISKVTQFARALVNANIAVQPTIQVIHGEREIFNPQYFDNSLVTHAIPQSLISWYKSDEGQWMKQVLQRRYPANIDEARELYKQVVNDYEKPIANVRSITKLFSENKGTLLFGSDTPSGPFYTQFPGVNARMEMQRWYESGISLITLFESMTVLNAQALGLANEIGKVEVGMKADLLLLHENPLKSISAYDSIENVVINGKVVERRRLSATSKK